MSGRGPDLGGEAEEAGAEPHPEGQGERDGRERDHGGNPPVVVDGGSVMARTSEEKRQCMSGGVI